MKAISLWEPWASLIALGYKTIETRSWQTPYRGPIAIQAAKKWDAELRETAKHEWPFAELLGAEWQPQLGMIVAVAELVVCKEMTASGIAARHREMTEKPTDAEKLADHLVLDYLLGNWEPGRYAWVLREVRALATPIPARGSQGIWPWEPPADLVLREVSR